MTINAAPRTGKLGKLVRLPIHTLCFGRSLFFARSVPSPRALISYHSYRRRLTHRSPPKPLVSHYHPLLGASGEHKAHKSAARCPCWPSCLLSPKIRYSMTDYLIWLLPDCCKRWKNIEKKAFPSHSSPTSPRTSLTSLVVLAHLAPPFPKKTSPLSLYAKQAEGFLQLPHF